MTLFGRLWGSLGTLLGAFGPFSSVQGLPGRTQEPLWKLFSKDLALRASFHYYIEVAIIQPLAAERPRRVTRSANN